MNKKEIDTGKIVITLEEYREAHNISKNKIVLGAGVQRTQLQKYCQNKVARVDLDVLARICHFLNCELSDIMRYEPGVDENETYLGNVRASYFILNTNISNSTEDDADMLLNQKAAAYHETKFAIKKIRKGDRVFLYRSGVGIVAVGVGSGQREIKNYHNDSAQEDEEYYTPLNSFYKLGKPLSANDMKRIVNENLFFNSTLYEMTSQAGTKLWDYINANCL